MGYGGYFFENEYKTAKLWNRLLEILKYFYDYFIKSYISPTEIYFKCGIYSIDYQFISSAPDSSDTRYCFKADPTKPASDVGFATATSLTIGSILFASKDPNYSAKLLLYA